MDRKIILYELNEVPFEIVDHFCQWQPASTLARKLAQCFQYETYTEDESPLSPWITWPTLHRGVIDRQHSIYNFGQDLSEVNQELPPIWELLTASGISTGICGTLHSYPMPNKLKNYSFYLPDTFAAGSECFPQELSVFQEFNLNVARESGRNVSSRLPWRAALKLLWNSPGLGLKPQTYLDVGLQLLSEKAQRWRRVRRRTYQSVLAFDVFMKQLRTTRPGFASFFTNHIASSMHRYWAARFPEDYEEFGYSDEWVKTYAGEIEFAMAWADRFFAQLVQFVDNNPDYQLWVTTSMGQAATHAQPVKTQLYITDNNRFMKGLGLTHEEWEVWPTMLPRYSFRITSGKITAFRRQLELLRIENRPIEFVEAEGGFFNIRLMHFNLQDDGDYISLDGKAIYGRDLGLQNVEIQDQAGTTAYHIPQGSLLIYDPKNREDKLGRTTISTLDIAPTLLKNFSVPVPEYMRTPAAIGGL